MSQNGFRSGLYQLGGQNWVKQDEDITDDASSFSGYRDRVSFSLDRSILI